MGPLSIQAVLDVTCDGVTHLGGYLHVPLSFSSHRVQDRVFTST